MIWGMVFPNGLICIKEITGTLNAQKYIALLDEFAVPYMKKNLKPGFSFIQDNCSCHTAKLTQLSFKSMPFRSIKFPPFSPDLNIMEDIWHIMCTIIYANSQPSNIPELRSRIHNAALEINSYERNAIKKLYGTYRKRLTTVLRNNGNLCNK